MLGTRNLTASALAASVLLTATSATLAQYGLERPSTLRALGRDPVSNRDTSAATTNPASLAFLPGAELRWTSMYLNEGSRVPSQGNAFAFGFPIPALNLATTLRYDMLQPPAGSALPQHNWLTWALALKTTETSALGVSWQRTSSTASWLHGLNAWNLGWTWRPGDAIGFGIAAKAIGGPSNEWGGRLEPAWEFATSLRPFGTDRVELGLSTLWMLPQGLADYAIPRGTLSWRLPGFGRLWLDGMMSDPTRRIDARSWLASAGFSLELDGPGGGASFGVGSMIGSDLRPQGNTKAANNIMVDVAFRSYRESAAVAGPGLALRLRIEDTPGARRHVALLRRLWTIAEREPGVDAVVLELHDSPASSLAHAQELRDAITNLQQHRKKVVCHVDDAGGNALYVCAGADRILMHPSGTVRYAGMSSTGFYFKGLLDKLGIHADFVRVGAHKSAPESFTNTEPSETTRADRLELLTDLHKQWLEGVGKGRKLATAELATRIAKGPFVASEAKLAGLIDDYAYEDEIEDKVSLMAGRPMQLVDELATRAPSEFGAQRSLAVVYVDGDMVDGRSQTLPLIGNRMAGAMTLTEHLRRLRKDPNIAGVLLRIESPGGSALAADTLWRELQLLAAQKRVVVSMGSVAASGGYYIASIGSRVFANPGTVTGSIGVFYGKADVAELMRRIGVNVETTKTSPRADTASLFRPYSEDERRELQIKVEQYYSVFLDRVSRGRHLSKEKVDATGQGKVFSGAAALAPALIDELGGMRQALAWLRQETGVTDTAPLVELPPPDGTLLGKVLGLEGVHSAEAPLLPPQVLQFARALAPFLTAQDTTPLARLEWTIDEP